MALVLNVDHSATSTSCGELTILDNTGNYNVSTNPTGWGSPNAVRSDYYIKLILALKKTTGDEYITVDAYNDNTVTSWTVDITEDGYYQVFAFACLAWNSGTTYALGHVVYSAAQDQYYKSLQASNLNNAVTVAAYWEVADEISDFTAAVDTYSQTLTYYSTDNHVELCNSRKCMAKALVNLGCGCEDCDCHDPHHPANIRLKIEMAEANEGLEQYTIAQEIIENLQEICTCVND